MRLSVRPSTVNAAAIDDVRVDQPATTDVAVQLQLCIQNHIQEATLQVRISGMLPCCAPLRSFLLALTRNQVPLSTVLSFYYSP
jgi:hypothetical protein